MKQLLLRWNRRRWRRRQEILAEAQRQQDGERRAAFARLMQFDTRAQPMLLRAPLLTPGQAARSHGHPR